MIVYLLWAFIGVLLGGALMGVLHGGLHGGTLRGGGGSTQNFGGSCGGPLGP